MRIISTNYPVTARANDSESTEAWAFILDGWLRLEYSVLRFVAQDLGVTTDNVQEQFDLVHVNFGQDGLYDGYYLPDAFDLTQDKYREYAEDHDTSEDTICVYNLNVEYLIFDSLQ